MFLHLSSWFPIDFTARALINNLPSHLINVYQICEDHTKLALTQIKTNQIMQSIYSPSRISFRDFQVSCNRVVQSFLALSSYVLDLRVASCVGVVSSYPVPSFSVSMSRVIVSCVRVVFLDISRVRKLLVNTRTPPPPQMSSLLCSILPRRPLTVWRYCCHVFVGFSCGMNDFPGIEMRWRLEVRTSLQGKQNAFSTRSASQVTTRRLIYVVWRLNFGLHIGIIPQIIPT